MTDRLRTLNPRALVFLEISQRLGFSQLQKSECLNLIRGRCANVDFIDDNGVIITRCQHCKALEKDAELIARNRTVRIRKELSVPDEVTVRVESDHTVATMVYDGHPNENNQRIVCITTRYRDPRKQNDVSKLLSS